MALRGPRKMRGGERQATHPTPALRATKAMFQARKSPATAEPAKPAHALATGRELFMRT